MLQIQSKIRDAIFEGYASYYSKLSGISQQKIADDVLSEIKIDEQVGIIESISGERIKGKKNESKMRILVNAINKFVKFILCHFIIIQTYHILKFQLNK